MLSAALAASCHDRCVGAGHCCIGNQSACANPSCDMGCMMGTVTPDEATCNATCSAASNKCSFVIGGFDFQMCGGCQNKWLNPQTLQPELIPGAPPYWPPGYQIPGCKLPLSHPPRTTKFIVLLKLLLVSPGSSCGDIHDECSESSGVFPSPPWPSPVTTARFARE